MPLAVCSNCERRFVVEDSSTGDRCSGCRQALRRVYREWGRVALYSAMTEDAGRFHNVVLASLGDD